VIESPETICEHIEVLTNFERLYSEFVRLLAEDRQSAFGPRHTARLERMQRDILEATPRVDVAAKASGHWLTTTNPPMMGGGVRSNNLAGQVMDIEEPGFADDGLRIPRMILQAIPIQIGALKGRLDEAEKRKPTRAERKAARRAEEMAAGREQQTMPVVVVEETVPRPSSEYPVEKAMEAIRPWHENPWVVGIGVTVIGGLLVVGILDLIGLLG
jgi:hypothetical protein